MSILVTDDGIVHNSRILDVDEISLAEYLERIFLRNSEKVAFVNTDTGEKYTYGELLQICKSIAAVLQKHGVASNDVVVFSARTTLRSCSVFLALVFCQSSTVIPKSTYTSYEFEVLLKNISPIKLAVGDTETKSKLENVTNIEILDVDHLWDLGQAANFRKPLDLNPKTSVLLMIFTSGSTGQSKAVCISHYNLVANLLQYKAPKGRFLLCNPITHLSGILSLFEHLDGATEIYICEETLKDNLSSYFDAVSKFKIENVFAMPVLLNKLAKSKFSEKLATLKCITTGGSTLPQPVIEDINTLYPHINLLNLFGASECSVVLKSCSADRLHRLAVIDSVQAKIIDIKSGQVLGPNQNGMLYIKSPSVALGYYKDKKSDEERFADGWYITGDVAYRDAEGYIVIVDRLKQMIKCLDCQVAPADLEVILMRDAEVLQAVAWGVPHPKFGEAPIAFIVPRHQSKLEELRKRLLQDIETNCAYYKRLHGGLYFVKKIPETDSGKFSRKDILRSHLKKELDYLD